MKHTTKNTDIHHSTPAIARLWLLRLLVPIGLHNKLILESELTNIPLAESIGLRKQGGPTKKHKPEKLRQKLRKLHEEAEQTATTIQPPSILAANMASLRKHVDLSDVECRILEFVILLNCETLLEEVTEWIAPLSTDKAISTLAKVLATPEQNIRIAFSRKSQLARTGLVALDELGTYSFKSIFDMISSRLAIDMTTIEIDPLDLIRNLVTPGNSPQLSLDDYKHIAPSIEILIPYLSHAYKAKRKGVNIYIYGAPGTGKSELGRVISKQLLCDAFEISCENEAGNPLKGASRLRALNATQAFFSNGKALLIFDEAEDVFNDSGILDKSTAQLRKAWINRMLEENPIPVLWLSNSSDLDPAFIRRFDMAFELTQPPKKHLEKIVQKACGDMIDAVGAARLAAVEHLTPGIITRAASVVRCIENDLPPTMLSQSIERLVSCTLEAQGHKGIQQYDASRLPDIYDPAFIQADSDLSSITRGLVSSRTGRICLFGPPGTGKTAYAKWLADQLQTPLICKQGSDLISPYLGETERNIDHAFRQASEEKALLLIDEVDSFLQDRRNAQRSWEVTAVNEMLTQMENYSGVFIASTNLMHNLDQAALRRFDLKVKFGYLKAEQAWQMLVKQCTCLGMEPPTENMRPELSALNVLTPGDFAAVARQHRFSPIKDADKFIAALKSECGIKEDGSRRPIGFLQQHAG